ncbi:aldose 1-epimerase [Mesorhizobium soli]|uniref:aldose epimerase family protein n=1 Tax=Pseudaminobacter soli (ex Li et al. 2025) TaxID=1295366 RepID=UPI002474A35C|nr:aldose epimerase family protein [Mesorhizobium soli]MDH6232709.1 aldose 1-epimerase [Mesorhizobium soli]
MSGGKVFGTTGDGHSVQRFEIAGGGLTAKIMNWGAVVQDLRLNGHDAPLVLGFERFANYPLSSPYFGAIVGRFANRISGGRFTLEGRRYSIDPERPESNGLHGGINGFGHRVWDVLVHGPDFVTFGLHDPDGEMGFPGALDVRCTYRLKIPGTLAIELTATCDEPTLCNLAHHSYFNLDDGGAGDILDHRIMLNAAAYLPVDGACVPTGVVKPVDDTPFDFRHARPIRMESEGEQLGYDNNFCLAAARGPLRQAAWVQGASSGVELEVWTTEPGVQLYVGQHLNTEARGLGGRRYKPYAGFCLEPQVWPDAPNRPYFPQATLWPGELYRQTTEYRFRLG